jgi:anti-anti-sigma factor
MFGVDLVVRKCDDHVIVTLSGELDMADSAEVGAALMAAAAGRKNTVVDLAGLVFIDCSGAAALARAQRLVRQAGGNLLLAAARPRIELVFELSRLIDVASVHASVDQATGACQRSGLAAVTPPGLLSLPAGT